VRTHKGIDRDQVAQLHDRGELPPLKRPVHEEAAEELGGRPIMKEGDAAIVVKREISTMIRLCKLV
jgi:hypothetical protein